MSKEGAKRTVAGAVHCSWCISAVHLGVGTVVKQLIHFASRNCKTNKNISQVQMVVVNSHVDLFTSQSITSTAFTRPSKVSKAKQTFLTKSVFLQCVYFAEKVSPIACGFFRECAKMDSSAVGMQGSQPLR